jgi:hypothetical protein
LTITGVELKGLIPDELSLVLDCVDFDSGDDEHAMLTLDTAHGAVSVVVYRRALAKLLAKNTTASSREKKPSEASKRTPSDYHVGKLRTVDGKKQRLSGFTNTSSPSERPRGVSRRVRHPDTNKMVWPLWVDA